MDPNPLVSSQVDILRHAFAIRQDGEPTRMSSVLLDKVSSLDDDAARQILGNMGVELCHTAKCVDVEHPDLPAFQGGLFQDSNKHTRRLCQVIDAWHYAKEQNWDTLLGMYRKVARFGLPSNIASIRSPLASMQCVRLIAEEAQRRLVRENKKVRLCNLQTLYKKGLSFWAAQPDSFDLFIPGSTKFQDQLAKQQKKASRFKSLGCDSLHKAMVDGVKDLKHSFEAASFNGFYRFALAQAVVILAKIHGFTLPENISTFDSRTVQVPEKFKKMFPEVENAPASTDEVEKQLLQELEKMVAAVVAKEGGKPEDQIISSFNCSFGQALVYNPSVYPLSVFIKQVCDGKPNLAVHQVDGKDVTVLDLVNHLDSNLQGKPSFDHYSVIVPSICPQYWLDAMTPKKQTPPPPKKKKAEKGEEKAVVATKEVKTAKPAKAATEAKEQEYVVVNGKGEQLKFASPREAQSWVDKELVLTQSVTPILVGERDGNTYFLSFWI